MNHAIVFEFFDAISHCLSGHMDLVAQVFPLDAGIFGQQLQDLIINVIKFHSTFLSS